MMKTQKLTVKQPTPKKPALQRSQEAVLNGNQEEERTPDSSTAGVVRPPSALKPEEIADAAEESMIEEKDSKKKERDPNGHKNKTFYEIVYYANKSKYLPLADGLNTGDVYFQPCSIVSTNQQWVDCEMIEYLFGASLMSLHHRFSLDANDLLKMIYLKEMFSNDFNGEARISFEEWLVKVFADIVKENPAADFVDHAMIASYLMTQSDFNWNLSSSPYVQVIFQKKCVHNIKDATGDVVLHGENPNMIKCKSTRGKFEYMIEGRIFSIFSGEGLGALPIPDSLDPLC